MVSIPNRTVALVGSRHLGVSVKHARGAMEVEAFDRGLTELAADGIIDRAYRDAGFLTPRVATWTRSR